MIGDPAGYEQWLRSVPAEIRADPLWMLPAYRFSLMLSDQCHQDVRNLRRDRMGRIISEQLYRSVSSISANLAEGYSRRTGPERARFYEYALGSAPESRDWLYKSRWLLDSQSVSERLALLTRIIRILSAVIPRERRITLAQVPGARQRL